MTIPESESLRYKVIHDQDFDLDDGGGGGGGLPQTGGGTFTADTATGSAAWGHALAGVGSILGLGRGSQAFGTAFGSGGGVAIIQTDADGDGSLVFGYADGNPGTATIQTASSAKGGLAFGHAYAPGGVTSVALIEADGGGIAFGVASAGGGGAVDSVTIRSGQGGAAFAYAVTQDAGNTVLVQADAGGLSFGYIYGGYTDSDLRITAAKGALAFGYIYHYNDSTDQWIAAEGLGSLAFGYSYGYKIHATAVASFAGGAADTADIVAQSLGSLQWGPGTNSRTNSLRVGNGIWLITNGPGDANGQMWVTSGKVGIYSDTATWVLDQSAHIADPAGGVVIDDEARTAINSILDALDLVGLTAAA